MERPSCCAVGEMDVLGMGNCWCRGSARGHVGKAQLLSLRDFLSDDESEKRNVQSSDDSFEPYPEKK